VPQVCGRQELLRPRGLPKQRVHRWQVPGGAARHRRKRGGGRGHGHGEEAAAPPHFCSACICLLQRPASTLARLSPCLLQPPHSPSMWGPPLTRQPAIPPQTRQAPTCCDSARNGNETGFNCGGPVAPAGPSPVGPGPLFTFSYGSCNAPCLRCPPGQGCVTAADCQPGLLCVNGACKVRLRAALGGARAPHRPRAKPKVFLLFLWISEILEIIPNKIRSSSSSARDNHSHSAPPLPHRPRRVTPSPTPTVTARRGA
jgi:hypothetical protein